MVWISLRIIPPIYSRPDATPTNLPASGCRQSKANWSQFTRFSATTAGLWFVSIAPAGYFVRIIAVPIRNCFAAAEPLALVPAGAFPGAGLTHVAGIFAGLALVVYEYFGGRAAAPVKSVC